MNYRHAFHAGNHADVLKHVVLLALLDALQRKPAAVWVLDTHAGRGLYRLDADEAVRTGEAGGGVDRLLARAAAGQGQGSEAARSTGSVASNAPNAVSASNGSSASTASAASAASAASGSTAPTAAIAPAASAASTTASTAAIASAYAGRSGAPEGPLDRYLSAVRACRAQHGAQAYPGSPWLVAHALRDADRLACCELQPEESAALRALFAGDARVAVHRRDGYEAMRALLPPTPRRGLVLVDPPYEAQRAEFDLIVAALRAALSRWPQGVYAVWYPIKQAADVVPFLRAATALPAGGAWTAELRVQASDSPLRMTGSGVLVLNPPWKLDAVLAPALAALGKSLAEPGGGAGVRWLRRAGG